jgi:hypothetical protein
MVRPDALAGVLGGSGAETRLLTTDDEPAAERDLVGGERTSA